MISSKSDRLDYFRNADFSGLVRAVEGGCLPVNRPRPKTRLFCCAVNLNRGLQIKLGPDARWLLAQNLVTILPGASTADLPEHPGKVLLRLEATRHGDIKNPHLGLAQHLLGTLYPLA